MIELSDSTKRYGPTVAVDHLSFEVRAGEVAGFLGPNGSGKSTTMRMMVGVDAPTSGQVTIDGQPYRNLRFPLRHVGDVLEAKAIHPGRSGDYLRWLADSNDISRRRVEEVLEKVILADLAGAAPAGSPSAWANASVSPRRCAATQPCCCSTFTGHVWVRIVGGWFQVLLVGRPFWDGGGELSSDTAVADGRAVTTAMSGVSIHDQSLAVGCDRSAAAFGDDGFRRVVGSNNVRALVRSTTQASPPTGSGPQES